MPGMGLHASDLSPGVGIKGLGGHNTKVGTRIITQVSSGLSAI